MGIRDMAMSPQPEEPKKEYGGYKPYPSYSNNDYGRYDGEYDSDKYYAKQKKEEEKEDPKNLITINLLITYKELGKQFVDEDGITFDSDASEFRAKELAYDKLIELLGKGFESKYSLTMDANDSYDEYEITITLTPTEKNA